MNKTVRQISKKGVLGLLGDLEAEGCITSVCVSAQTLRARDFDHLLPESEEERSLVAAALEESGSADTGVAVFVTGDRVVAIRPPIPLDTDIRTARAHTDGLRRVLSSEPVIGVVLLRLGRYAVGVLRGESLIATKTDSRYMKNRHRAGGQSQRRFQRSRERLIRELYDKTCEITRTVFSPYLQDMDYLLLGGERGTLNGFVKRCPMMRQELEPKLLTRRLAVDQPNQKALNGTSREVWKSSVTFFEEG
ncbi:MAG: Vms1/Ankzf1 family peptidyl-tRNA hydrolase [Dehalococcoidia bacterium]|nr:Vms1/Ankzf1 family peptidyl-tRNA hydrolase [Dehalococcoidia bacterium]